MTVRREGAKKPAPSIRYGRVRGGRSVTVPAHRLSSERAAPIVGHCAGDDEDDVDDPPDAETTSSDELQDAGADLTEVETVDAERA